MTRHLLRLIWNRKRANFLILTEIFISFLVLFAVVILSLRFAVSYRQPLGFTIDRVWSISIDPKDGLGDDDALHRQQRETTLRLFRAIGDMPQIEAACALDVMPYDNSSWSGRLTAKGVPLRFLYNSMTDDCARALDVPITRGRWPAAADQVGQERPVLLNEQFARELFGDEDPVGRIIETDEDQAPVPGVEPSEPMRVIGVVRDFRQDGELSTPDRYLIQRYDLIGGRAGAPSHFAIRFRAGTPAEFEETLVRRLQAAAPDWSFEARPAAALRTDNLRLRALPVIAFAVIAGFLLMMVALGLTGVLWQNVTQRTREFGLRRAKGATVPNVQRQVLAELSLTTTLALVLGVGLVLQLTLLPRPDDLDIFPAPIFLGSLGLSVVAMYLLTLACAWYPSRLATKIQPADALHYE